MPVRGTRAASLPGRWRVASQVDRYPTRSTSFRLTAAVKRKTAPTPPQSNSNPAVTATSSPLVGPAAQAPVLPAAPADSTPTATPSPTETPSPSPTPTPSSTPTALPTATGVVQPLSFAALVQALRLPNSAFAPAQLDNQDRVEDNASANADIFSSDHSRDYEVLGRLSGYYEEATYQPPNAKETASYRYQASVFRTSAQARAAWEDGLRTVHAYFGQAITPCADGTCALTWATKAQTGTLVAYFAAYTNYCLAEMQDTIPAAIFQSTAGGPALISALDDAAQQLLQRVCTEPPPAPPAPTPTTPPYPATEPNPTAVSAPLFPTSVAVPVSVHGFTAGATVSDPRPHPDEVVTVYGWILDNGHAMAGVPMTTEWTSKGTTVSCSGVSNSNGLAWCSINIGEIALDTPVTIKVTFTVPYPDVNGHLLQLTTTTGFTPEQ
jgi:hypothetical protein